MHGTWQLCGKAAQQVRRAHVVDQPYFVERLRTEVRMREQSIGECWERREQYGGLFGDNFLHCRSGFKMTNANESGPTRAAASHGQHGRHVEERQWVPEAVICLHAKPLGQSVACAFQSPM